MKADREKLRLAMARKCLTSAELANQAGVPRSTANNVISGRNVRPVTIGQIAKALNVDVLDLLDTTEPH